MKIISIVLINRMAHLQIVSEKFFKMRAWIRLIHLIIMSHSKFHHQNHLVDCSKMMSCSKMIQLQIIICLEAHHPVHREKICKVMMFNILIQTSLQINWITHLIFKNIWTIVKRWFRLSPNHQTLQARCKEIVNQPLKI